MAFDYLTFLHRYNIDHDTSGRHTRRDWISVICPWCGPADPHHLGINTKLGIYHCWHGGSHSGKSAPRLVQALLNCSAEEARSIVGLNDASFATTDDTLAADSFRRLGIVVEQQARPPRRNGLEFLPEFSPLRDTGLCRTLVMPYLCKRGYGTDDALWLAERYQLMFAATGPFAYRIIIPVIVDRQVVNWTGRSVAASEELRYKSLSTDPERAQAQRLPVAVAGIKDTLFDYDNVARGGDMLVLTEGPFDAMRCGFLGESQNVRATCLFSKQATATQIDLLSGVVVQYDTVIALFDQDARFDPFLTFPDYLKVERRYLPRGIKDPAELSDRQFIRLL